MIKSDYAYSLQGYKT